MAAVLLVGLYANDSDDGKEHEDRNVTTERLLKPYMLNSVLINNYFK